MITAKTDWRMALALGAVSGVYVWLAFGWLPAGGYWLPDTGMKRIQAANVRFTPALDLTIDYPGQALDPGFKFLPFTRNFYFIWGERVHFAQPFAIALLSRPFILLGGDYGERVAPLLAGLVSVCLTARLAQALGAPAAWLSVLLAGLATPLLFYSLNFWEHTLAVALGLGALVLVLRPAHSPPPSARQFVLSGLLMGLAGVVRKELILCAFAAGLALAVMAVARRRWRGLAAWWGVCAGVFGLYLLASYLNSGHPVPPEFRISAVPGFTAHAYLRVKGWGGVADFVFDPRYGAWGVWLLAALGVYGLARLGPRAWLREGLQIVALAALGLGVGVFIWRESATPYLRGIFSASPVLALGLAARVEDRRLARALALTAGGFWALAILALGFLTAAGAIHGAGEWGSRFLLILFPLGAPFAASGLQAIRDRAARGVLARLHWIAALALVALSLLIQALGVARLREGNVTSLALRQAILALPERQVVTNQIWLAPRLPEVYLSKEVFRLDTREEWAEWVRAAYAQGVRRFVFASSGLPDPALLAAAAPPGTRIAIVEVRDIGGDFYVTRLEILSTP